MSYIGYLSWTPWRAPRHSTDEYLAIWRRPHAEALACLALRRDDPQRAAEGLRAVADGCRFWERDGTTGLPSGTPRLSVAYWGALQRLADRLDEVADAIA